MNKYKSDDYKLGAVNPLNRNPYIRIEPVYLFLVSVHDNHKIKEMKHMVTHDIDYIVYIMELTG